MMSVVMAVSLGRCFPSWGHHCGAVSSVAGVEVPVYFKVDASE
jgi:hypothetical protein